MPERSPNIKKTEKQISIKDLPGPALVSLLLNNGLMGVYSVENPQRVAHRIFIMPADENCPCKELLGYCRDVLQEHGFRVTRGDATGYLNEDSEPVVLESNNFLLPSIPSYSPL